MQYEEKPLHYILEDGVPKPVELMEYINWRIEHEKETKIAYTELSSGGVAIEVSTIFLGLDADIMGDVPILFETMIFGGSLDKRTRRYATLDEALKGHEEEVALVCRREGVEPPAL